MMYEAIRAYVGQYLFCSALGFTKQISGGILSVFCLILPLLPHVLCSCLTISLENMRI